MEFEPFLDAVSEEGKGEEDIPFRVICNVMYESKFVTLVFSSVTGKWQAATTFNYEYADPFVRHYAHSCFYWTHCARTSMLVLDPREMKFSVVNLPPSFHQGWSHLNNDRAIVDVGDDRLGLLSFGSETQSLELFSMTMRNNGVDTEEWQLDRKIPLPVYLWSMCDAAAGCLFMHGIERDWYKMPKYSKKDPEKQYFVLDLKTLLVEMICVFDPITAPAFLYASFPPPLSLPSI